VPRVQVRGLRQLDYSVPSHTRCATIGCELAPFPAHPVADCVFSSVLLLHARGLVVVAASARCSLRFMLSTRVRASVESFVIIQGHFDSAWAFGRRIFFLGGCPLVLVMRVVFMVGVSGGSPAFVTVIFVS
jgi:hypothetical protein